MTKKEILMIKTGRELDAVIEGKLFGHRIEVRYCNWLPGGWYEVQSYGEERIGGGLLDEDELHPCYLEGERWAIVPFYSTDISAAWQLVDIMIKSGRYFGLQRVIHNEQWLWEATFLSQIAFTNTAPEAICKAALLATLGQGEERRR